MGPSTRPKLLERCQNGVSGKDSRSCVQKEDYSDEDSDYPGWLRV